MDNNLIWLVGGFALIIAELVTGTFYLLVLGVAAFAGAAMAWLDFTFHLQAIVAAAIASVGIFWVNRYRRRLLSSAPMKGLDIGQPATFQSWVDRSAGHARVKYRDALWDAQIVGEAAGEAGEILYVTSVDGSTLKVSKNRQA